MESDTLCFLSLQDLSAQLRTGKLSSVEVTRCILDRIHRMNPRLHAYLTVLDESALYRAAQVDEEIRAGHWRGPLHGVPIAVKDLCQTKGVLTTCASPILRGWRPDSSATVVERLEAAGAVLVGKLNLTEFATFWYHPEMPVPLNPWDAALWPGASSSGSGVATSAALCFASIGTDTGGSIRYPSAACGIVGLKPTLGKSKSSRHIPAGRIVRPRRADDQKRRRRGAGFGNNCWSRCDRRHLPLSAGRRLRGVAGSRRKGYSHRRRREIYCGSRVHGGGNSRTQCRSRT